MRQLLRRRPAGSIDSEPDGESGRSSHGRPRPWLVIGMLALLVVGVCAGWFLVTLFQSPEQRAADAEPPERGPLFSAVTVGALAETLTLQGEIESGSVHQLTLPVSGVDKLTVVTAHPVDGGARIEAGEQITEANGRPVLLIQSPFDLYRDLGLGDSGPDVENLQETLVKRGLLNQADGRFGAATASAEPSGIARTATSRQLATKASPARRRKHPAATIAVLPTPGSAQRPKSRRRRRSTCHSRRWLRCRLRR